MPSTFEVDSITAITTDSNITIKANGSGKVSIGDGNLLFPDSDGSSGQIIKTNGSGALSFTTSPADNSIDSDQYVDGSIDTAHYAAGSVDATALGADAVTAAKIGDNVLNSEHYAAGSIDNEHIADDAIDSEHYAAGSIDTAHIADDAVTLAKMVSATDGVIITYDASGNPVHVGPGNDGQLLTSTGAGSPPAFEDAAGGGPSQATQAALEAGTNEDTYAPPDLIKHSPGVAKAWVKFDRAGTVNASHNITSVTDTGSGDWTVNIATDFSSGEYTGILSIRRDSGLPDAMFNIGAQAAGTLQFVRGDTNGDIADAAAADDMHATMFGDQ